MLKIGLRLDCLALGPREALARAASLKMDGVEIPAAWGDFHPRALDRSGRRALRHYLEDLRIGLAALGADAGFRFEDESRVECFVDTTRAILEMAVDLKTAMLTTAVGAIPEKPEDRRYQVIREVLKELADDAANRGCSLALSAGQGPPEALRRFLDDLKHDGLRVNYDPANLVFSGHDPARSVALLGPYIAAVRARDGRRYLDGSKEELPLGTGDVPFDAVMEALGDFDFHGYLVIARRPHEKIEEEIEAAHRFLKRYL
ncbi:MAG: sugar phosphate isomerase/epimerase [Planctomycetes bacterium]|nr:sugar phosphate isomerase/epimerase [Planctomycetota bacterium]